MTFQFSDTYPRQVSTFGFARDESKISLFGTNFTPFLWEGLKKAVSRVVRQEAWHEVEYHASQREFLVYDHEIADEAARAALEAVSVNEQAREIVVSRDDSLFDFKFLGQRLEIEAQNFAVS